MKLNPEARWAATKLAEAQNTGEPVTLGPNECNRIISELFRLRGALEAVERLTAENARLRAAITDFGQELESLAEHDSWTWAMNEMYSEINDRFGEAMSRLADAAATNPSKQFDQS